MKISMGETHVHISNTNVKPRAADGSAMYCGVRVGDCQAFFLTVCLVCFYPVLPFLITTFFLIIQGGYYVFI